MPPVRIPRRQLRRALAVLLMQSCYLAVDVLDFYPMVRHSLHASFYSTLYSLMSTDLQTALCHMVMQFYFRLHYDADAHMQRS